MITTKLLTYACGALLLTTIAAGGLASCEHSNAEVARAERDALQAKFDTVTDANDSNQVTLAACKREVDEWKAQCALTEETKALASKAETNAANLEKLRRENQRLRALDSTPACIQVLRTDITAACPTVDTGLRRLTEGCNQDSDGGNSCTDPEAFATGTR